MSDTDPTDPAPVVRTDTRVRRAPRYRRFVQAGVVAGAVVGLVVALVLPGREGSVGTPTIAVVLAVGGAFLGALVGGVVAVLLDGRAGRHPRSPGR